jgi:tetratricopeptide (TPR) repeat protein
MKEQPTREDFKLQGIEMRENGKLKEALKLFRQIEDTDIQSDNVKGRMEILDEIRTVYAAMGDVEKDVKAKKDFFQKALNTAEEAIDLGRTHTGISKESLSLQEVHLASALLDTVKDEADMTLKRTRLSDALSLVDHAIQNLPGSLANRAWPANLKAKIEYELGSIDDSLHTLVQAQEWVLKGYEEEMKKDSQAEMKLNIWLSGLMLTTADICAKEDKPFLAKHYCAYILSMYDPKGYLSDKKREAQKILDFLQNPKIKK